MRSWSSPGLCSWSIPGLCSWSSPGLCSWSSPGLCSWSSPGLCSWCSPVVIAVVCVGRRRACDYGASPCRRPCRRRWRRRSGWGCSRRGVPRRARGRWRGWGASSCRPPSSSSSPSSSVCSSASSSCRHRVVIAVAVLKVVDFAAGRRDATCRLPPGAAGRARRGVGRGEMEGSEGVKEEWRNRGVVGDGGLKGDGGACANDRWQPLACRSGRH